MTQEKKEKTRTRWLPSVGILALAICLGIAALVYFTHGQDPLAFAVLGSRYASGDPSGNVGYDGQFAYYIALDPLGASARIDVPAYRYQRLLYPLLAYLFALGQPVLVPWTLLLINILSISAGTELLGRALRRGGLSPYLALFFPLWLGQVFALRADLNEPLCFLLVLMALYGYERERYPLSAAALAAGALAKELALLFLPPVLLVLLLQKRWRRAASYFLVVSLPYAVLQCGLYLWFGETGFAGQGASFEWIPFYGIAVSEPPALRVFMVLFFALPVTMLLLLAVRKLLQAPRSLHGWALLVNCLFIVFLTRLSVADVLAFSRLATGVVVAALLFCAAHGMRWVALVLHVVWLPPTVLTVMIPGFLF